MEISGKEIAVGRPVYFIADIAANHDGDLGLAKELIWMAAECGADAAKFQHFQAESIVSDEGFRALGSQLSHQSSWKKSVFEVYQDASVPESWSQQLHDTCAEAGIPFLTTPYNLDVIPMIDWMVPAYKIGSGDITWAEMLTAVAERRKPVLLATGASTMNEVVDAVEIIRSINQDLCIMQCNTNYTADPRNFSYIQLNVLKSYAAMFPEHILGLSDHTSGHATVLGAVALGAKIIEKHFTLDCSREGPDHKFSMDPITWREMVDRTRELEAALGEGIKRVEANEKETVVLQRRALRASRDFIAGEIIKPGDFEALRPCPVDAFSPARSREAIGKKIKHAMAKGDYLKLGDLCD